MGTGFLSRKIGVLKSGDERVLSAYVYYFALPAFRTPILLERKPVPIKRRIGTIVRMRTSPFIVFPFTRPRMISRVFVLLLPSKRRI